jgi:hypothetical protein
MQDYTRVAGSAVTIRTVMSCICLFLVIVRLTAWPDPSKLCLNDADSTRFITRQGIKTTLYGFFEVWQLSLI